ncbi:facilitated trehalose transporter Tret1-like isoform X2 [Lycorma delicatula]|uniref:facilitated trehalose transporter Tret1-like isoform X2 n=1 Tax=Lycorma delicatula TaxID=130591 RepID=UPI003F511FBE
MSNKTYKWVRKVGVKMRKKEDIMNGRRTKRFARFGVCAGCSLYCLACGLELELSDAITNKISEENQKLLSKWSPGYWQTMGSLLGCLISGISLCYMGRRTSLQRVAIPFLALACIITYTSTKVSSESSLFLIVSTLQIFMQNISRSLSIIIPPIYILETICWHPGSYKSRAAAVLLGLTQIPPGVANVMMSIQIIRSDTYSAILVPLLIMVISVLTLSMAPESPRWLLQIKDRVNEAMLSLKSLWSEKSAKHDINKEAAIMHREMQVTLCEPDSNIRPLLVLSCFLLLVQLMGYGAYHFYANWAYTFSGITTINSEVVTSIIRMISISISIMISILYPEPKYISILLSITTSLLMLCLVTTGVCMYTLEQGKITTDQLVWLPISLLIIYQTSYWLGIGTYAIPTCMLIMPPKSRPIILTISITVYQMSSYFCEIFLPLMISVLHPFGVFWFHASLTAVGLIYTSLVISPELSWTAKKLENNESSETRF